MSGTSDNSSRDFESELKKWLENIDSQLAKNGTPIPTRPFQAAAAFVKLAVVEIEGDTKDDYISKPWFKPIYESVERWYRHRFGAAFESQSKESMTGACMILDDVFEINVPNTLRKIEKEGETAWLIFPTDVQEGENPSDWLVRPPNLEILQPEDKVKVLREVEAIGSRLRQIYVDLMTAERPDELAIALANKILPQLEQAAVYLIEPHRRNLGLACWEAHQGAEHALKLLCRQKSGKHRHTHDLKSLHQDIASNDAGFLNSYILDGLPSGKEITKIRGGERGNINVYRAYSMYRTFLDLTASCTSTLERKLRLKNAGFLLRKAPFLD